MYSRAKWLLLILIFSFVAGCAKQDEPVAFPEPMAALGSKTQCLDEALPSITRYFSGDVSAQQLDEFWTCNQNVLRLFLIHIRGTDANRFTARELRSFLQTYMLKEYSINDLFLAEAMHLKQLFLGGSQAFVTKSELESTIDLMDVFRSYTQAMLPFMKVYGANPEQKVTLVQFEESRSILMAIAADLGKRLSVHDVPYTMGHLQNLVRGLADMYRSKSRWERIERIAELLPVLNVVKELMVAPGAEIRASDWSQLLSVAVRFYHPLLRSQVYVDGWGWETRAGSEQMQIAVNDWFMLLDEAIERSPTHLIEYHYFVDVLKSLRDVNLLPDAVTDEDLLKLVRLAVSEWFLPKSSQFFRIKKIAEGSRSGLTASVLGWYKERVSEFFSVQNYVEGFARGEKPANPQKEFEYFTALANEKLRWNVDRKLVIPAADGLAPDAKELAKMNLVRGIFRALIMVYGTSEGGVSEQGLKLDEYLRLFRDLRKVLVAMKLIGEDFKAEKIMEHSNLFTPHADGNQVLSLQEGFEFYMMVDSSQIFANAFWPRLLQNCENDGENVDATCALNFFAGEFFDMQPELKNLLVYNQGLNIEDKIKFSTFLSKAVVTKEDTAWTKSDVLQMKMFAQYIEQILARFDADGNQNLSVAESLQTFPLFQNILQRASGTSNVDDLQAIFTYIVANGREPNVMQLVWWKLKKSSWEFTADRTRMAQILSLISNKTSK